jgi:hydroxymethylglutaryl-CoA reductase
MKSRTLASITFALSLAAAGSGMAATVTTHTVTKTHVVHTTTRREALRKQIAAKEREVARLRKRHDPRLARAQRELQSLRRQERALAAQHR